MTVLFPDSHPMHENLGMRLLPQQKQQTNKQTNKQQILCNYFASDFRDKSALRNHQSFYPRATKGAVTSVRHHYHHHHHQLLLLVMMYTAGWVKRAHLKLYSNLGEIVEHGHTYTVFNLMKHYAF